MTLRGAAGSLVAAALSAACAAGASKQAAPPPVRPAAARPLDAGASAAPDGEDAASLEDLAKRGRASAPLMREVARVADATRPTELSIAVVDGCVRAAVSTSRPARAWFEDASRTPRGEPASSGADGAEIALVPPRGPACARKGEVLRLVVAPEGTPAVARAVVWQSP